MLTAIYCMLLGGGGGGGGHTNYYKLMERPLIKLVILMKMLAQIICNDWKFERVMNVDPQP